jgi:hypothetical protein
MESAVARSPVKIVVNFGMVQQQHKLEEFRLKKTAGVGPQEQQWERLSH